MLFMSFTLQKPQFDWSAIKLCLDRIQLQSKNMSLAPNLSLLNAGKWNCDPTKCPIFANSALFSFYFSTRNLLYIIESIYFDIFSCYVIDSTRWFFIYFRVSVIFFDLQSLSYFTTVSSYCLIFFVFSYAKYLNSSKEWITSFVYY